MNAIIVEVVLSLPSKSISIAMIAAAVAGLMTPFHSLVSPCLPDRTFGPLPLRMKKIRGRSKIFVGRCGEVVMNDETHHSFMQPHSDTAMRRGVPKGDSARSENSCSVVDEPCLRQCLF